MKNGFVLKAHANRAGIVKVVYTQGSFDFFDGATRMGTFWWDAPWAPGEANTWGFSPASDVYVGQVTGGHSSAPEIGAVKLRLTKF